MKNEVDTLNWTAEKDLTLSERQLIDSIRNNIDRHKDTILEHGYTLVLLIWLILRILLDLSL